MSRTLLLFVFLLITSCYAFGQDVTVYQIQFTTDPSGDSPLRDSTVFTGGIVTGVDYTGQPIRYFVADRVGGLWSGILVNDNQDRQLSVGDSVRFQAQVQESSNQTRLRNIVTGTFSTVPQMGTVSPLPIATNAVNESTEGVLIEFEDAVVVSINADGFVVSDGSGNATIGEGWSYSYEPLVGDTLTYLRGIVSSSGSVYTVNPRSDSDFGFLGNRPPLISNVLNTPLSPTELQADTITAAIFDEDGVQSASVYYRFGEAGDYAMQAMNDNGVLGDRFPGDGIWTGVIPAGSARTSAYYYVCAADNEGLSGCSPADAPESAYSYLIRSSILMIFDLQYTGDPTGGSSPYVDSVVTVTGIVTGTQFSSYTDGYFISDPGGGLWGGLQVYNPASTPAQGDCVRVTAQIDEFNGLTETVAGATYTLLGPGTIPPPLPMRFSQWADSAEPFEGTLVRVDAPMVVSSLSGWSTYQQFDIRSGSVTVTAIADFMFASPDFEYVPEVGDSILWLVGCITYNDNTTSGWMVAPRADADIGYVDRRPPTVVSASAVLEHDLNVSFNERLDPDVGGLDNFEVVDQSDPEFPALHIESAYLFSTGRVLHLTFLEELDPEHAYRLTAHSLRDLAGNVLTDAAISFGGYEPEAFTPIATLYDSFSTYDGRTVTLRGIVNFMQDVTTTSGSRRISAYMQDESGKGFSLSNSATGGAAAAHPGIQRGNWIRISGVVNQFEGVIQLGSFTSSSTTVLAENVPLPDPIVIHTGDYRAQRRIVRVSDPSLSGAGTWVKSSGTIYRVDENIGGGTNIAIDDGTGNLTIRIWDSMNLDSVELNDQWFLLRDLVGKYVHVAGPSSTFDGDFQMLAGYAEDFSSDPFTDVPSETMKLELPARAFAPDLGQAITIKYDAPALSQVRLRIFDLRGRLVRTLVDKQAGGPGIYTWDGRTDVRELVPIGTYILHLESVKDGKSDAQTKPIVVGTKL